MNLKVNFKVDKLGIMSRFGSLPADHPMKTRLAEGPGTAVDLCACGTFYVSIGALTLRLPAEAVATVWATLGDALAAAEERQVAVPVRTNVRRSPGSLS